MKWVKASERLPENSTPETWFVTRYLPNPSWVKGRIFDKERNSFVGYTNGYEEEIELNEDLEWLDETPQEPKSIFYEEACAIMGSDFINDAIEPLK